MSNIQVAYICACVLMASPESGLVGIGIVLLLINTAVAIGQFFM